MKTLPAVINFARRYGQTIELTFLWFYVSVFLSDSITFLLCMASCSSCFEIYNLIYVTFLRGFSSTVTSGSWKFWKYNNLVEIDNSHRGAVKRAQRPLILRGTTDRRWIDAFMKNRFSLCFFWLYPYDFFYLAECCEKASSVVTNFTRTHSLNKFASYIPLAPFPWLSFSFLWFDIYILSIG